MTDHNVWYLESIEIKFQNFGENKGKYEGRIRFQNGDYESFSFMIRPDMAEPYINLIAEDVIKAAENLGQRLIESLRLKERLKS